MLKNEIRKKIVETKERKEKLLIEEKLVESRIMMIVESKDNFKNFHLLSEEKQLKFGFSLMREFYFLSNNGLLNEQLGDFLSKIFGNSLSAVSQTAVEPMLNSILGGLGLKGYFKDFILSFLISDPKRLMAAFKDCQTLTSLISESLSEALVTMIQRQKGLEGAGYTLIRNLLGGAIKDTSFIKKIEEGISEKVCHLFGSFTDNAKNVYEKLKPSVEGGVDKVQGLVSKDS
jgi:hypothetical protein